MNNDQRVLDDRILYTDFLRVISILLVMMLHAAATKKSEAIPYTFEWTIMNTVISVARWSVPIFIMISGYFFLQPSKEISLKTMFLKYIKRIVLAFLFWSFLYAIATTNSAIRALDPNAFLLVLEKTFKGHAQYWFLLMLLGLYLVTPILKVFTRYAEEKLLRYFLIIAFVFSSVLPLFQYGNYFELFKQQIAGLEVYLVLGYPLYYVLGYYLGTYHISRGIRKIVYLLGILGAVITSFGFYISITWLGQEKDVFQDYLMFSNVFMAIAVFLIVQQWLILRVYQSKFGNIIHTIAEYSFGMYLTHDIFNMIFYKLGINILQFGVILGILIFTVVDFIGSFLLVYVLHKIPLLRSIS